MSEEPSHTSWRIDRALEGKMDERTAEQWLIDQFEFEYCEECGGDEANHNVILLDFGEYGANYFAQCKTVAEVE